jgi:hypothetical protein
MNHEENRIKLAELLATFCNSGMDIEDVACDFEDTLTITIKMRPEHVR